MIEFTQRVIDENENDRDHHLDDPITTAIDNILSLPRPDGDRFEYTSSHAQQPEFQAREPFILAEPVPVMELGTPEMVESVPVMELGTPEMIESSSDTVHHASANAIRYIVNPVLYSPRTPPLPSRGDETMDSNGVILTACSDSIDTSSRIPAQFLERPNAPEPVSVPTTPSLPENFPTHDSPPIDRTVTWNQATPNYPPPSTPPMDDEPILSATSNSDDLSHYTFVTEPPLNLNVTHPGMMESISSTLFPHHSESTLPMQNPPHINVHVTCGSTRSQRSNEPPYLSSYTLASKSIGSQSYPSQSLKMDPSQTSLKMESSQGTLPSLAQGTSMSSSPHKPKIYSQYGVTREILHESLPSTIRGKSAGHSHRGKFSWECPSDVTSRSSSFGKTWSSGFGNRIQSKDSSFPHGYENQAVKAYGCGYCNYKALMKSELAQHVASAHRDNNSLSKLDKVPQKLERTVSAPSIYTSSNYDETEHSAMYTDGRDSQATSYCVTSPEPWERMEDTRERGPSCLRSMSDLILAGPQDLPPRKIRPSSGGGMFIQQPIIVREEPSNKVKFPNPYRRKIKRTRPHLPYKEPNPVKPRETYCVEEKYGVYPFETHYVEYRPSSIDSKWPVSYRTSKAGFGVFLPRLVEQLSMTM